jgi:hypothetical protein
MGCPTSSERTIPTLICRQDFIDFGGMTNGRSRLGRAPEAHRIKAGAANQ